MSHWSLCRTKWLQLCQMPVSFKTSRLRGPSDRPRQNLKVTGKGQRSKVLEQGFSQTDTYLAVLYLSFLALHCLESADTVRNIQFKVSVSILLIILLFYLTASALCLNGLLPQKERSGSVCLIMTMNE